MTDVEIEYCGECDFRSQAIDTANEVLKNHQSELDGVHLKVGKGGVFKVRVDGDVVWDKDIKQLDVREVEQNIRPKLGVSTPS